jgi:hypothetical protein
MMLGGWHVVARLTCTPTSYVSAFAFAASVTTRPPKSPGGNSTRPVSASRCVPSVIMSSVCCSNSVAGRLGGTWPKLIIQ